MTCSLQIHLKSIFLFDGVTFNFTLPNCLSGCEKSCPQNKIDLLFCRCLCLNTTVEGTVISHELGIPLSNASVLVENPAQGAWLVTTNASGRFKTRMDTCAGDHAMIVKKRGYASVRLGMIAIQDHWYQEIEMRHAGESVSFCFSVRVTRGFEHRRFFSIHYGIAINAHALTCLTLKSRT